MTIEELIIEEIERIPTKKQTDLQQKCLDLYKEKEHYRYEMVAQEQRADKWKKAYEKLYKKYTALLETVENGENK